MNNEVLAVFLMFESIVAVRTSKHIDFGKAFLGGKMSLADLT